MRACRLADATGVGVLKEGLGHGLDTRLASVHHGTRAHAVSMTIALTTRHGTAFGIDEAKGVRVRVVNNGALRCTGQLVGRGAAVRGYARVGDAIVTREPTTT